MLKSQIGVLLLGRFLSLHSLAADNLYTVFSAGYSNLDLSEESNDGLNYKIAFGYQIDPQWYVEAGYQQLIHDKLYVTEVPNADDVINGESVQQGDALFLAFLGKASGPMGELFYRLGVLKTDLRGQQLLAGDLACEMGSKNSLMIANYGAATLCDYDESGVAGVIGLGFDYFIDTRTMLRGEIEYIKGQDNLTVTAATIGVRYNF
mgnify:FL=1